MNTKRSRRPGRSALPERSDGPRRPPLLGQRGERPRQQWDAVRAFALALPGAAEDFPWGETVIKVPRKPGSPPWIKEGGVYGPMFLWMGRPDLDAPFVCVKLTTSYEEAVAVASAERTTISGLGQWGWLTVRLSSVGVDLVCDWVEESYRNVAPKRFVAELEARR